MTGPSQTPDPISEAEWRAWAATITQRCVCCEHAAIFYGEALTWRRMAFQQNAALARVHDAQTAQEAARQGANRLIDAANTLIEGLTVRAETAEADRNRLAVALHHVAQLFGKVEAERSRWHQIALARGWRLGEGGHDDCDCLPSEPPEEPRG